MTSTPSPTPTERRAAVRRTAWIFGGLAVASYLVFLFSVLAGK